MPLADPITAGYSARLAAQRAGMLALVRALWQRQFNPADPWASLTALGALVTVLTTRAQASAVAETRGYLQAFTADSTGRPVEDIEPYPLPPDIVGRSLSGQPLDDVTGMARAVYWQRLNGGASQQQAEDSALAVLNRTAANEPMWAARATTLNAIAVDDRLEGRYERLTAANACNWCILISDRGYTPAATFHSPRAGARNAGAFAAHDFCQCKPGPIISQAPARRRPAPARPEQPAEFALTGDWVKDRQTIMGLDTSDWFGRATTYQQRLDALERLDAIGKAVEREAQRRYDLWFRGAGYVNWDSRLEAIARYRLNVLGEIRSMGGVLDIKGKGGPMAEYIRYGQQFYPTQWIQSMNDRGNWIIRQVDRGYFQQYGRTIGISRGRGTNGSRSTAIHELGHGVQAYNNQLQVAERTLHIKRTTNAKGVREKLVQVTPGKAYADEKGRKDKYKIAYSGREYGDGNPQEVITTTAESIFGYSDYADTEMMRWLLGMMAVL